MITRKKKQKNVGYSLMLVFLGLIVSYSQKGCCKTAVEISIIRGTMPPSEKTGGGAEVAICPGEPVTLGWGASPDVTSASISGIGSVPPKGSRTVYPSQSTEYTISVKGDCTRETKCKVNVIRDGNLATISARLVESPPDPKLNKPLQYNWERTIDETYWSPNIVVTSIRMVRFVDDAFNQLAPWQFIKTDTNGTVHDFPVLWEFTSPWGSATIFLVGNWKIYMIGGVYPNNPPAFANFEVTMRCAR